MFYDLQVNKSPLTLSKYYKYPNLTTAFVIHSIFDYFIYSIENV